MGNKHSSGLFYSKSIMLEMAVESRRLIRALAVERSVADAGNSGYVAEGLPRYSSDRPKVENKLLETPVRLKRENEYRLTSTNPLFF